MIYARQSKNRTASIEDQIAEGLARFEAEGWPEPLVFRDGTGASRHSTGTRDDWPEVVELMETGQRNLLWLWEQSRGGRVAWEFLRVLQTCAELGVLVYIEEQERLFDMDNDADWEAAAGQAVRDEAETNKLARRTTRAKRQARARGNLRRVYGHQPPIGYRDGDDDWETDPDHQAMLREVATAMLPPFSQRMHDAFRAWTAANGPLYRNRSGGGRGEQITEKALHKALRLPVTAALITGPPERDPQTKRWVKRGPITGQAEPPGGPPLDRDTWEELQRHFAEAVAGRRPKAEVYPHGRDLACAECGNQLTGSRHYWSRVDGTRVVVSTYTCMNPHKIPGTSPPEYRKPCRKVTILAGEVNEALRFAVARWWTEHAADFAAADPADPWNAVLSGEHARLTARREHLEHQRQVFARKWQAQEQGWTEEFYEEMDASAASALARVQAELDELAHHEQTTAEQARAAREGRLPPELENWDELSAGEKSAWVRKAFETPVRVLKKTGTGRNLATDERLLLIQRPPR